MTTRICTFCSQPREDVFASSKFTICSNCAGACREVWEGSASVGSISDTPINSRLACVRCRRGRGSVARMAGTPNVQICDECLSIVSAIKVGEAVGTFAVDAWGLWKEWQKGKQEALLEARKREMEAQRQQEMVTLVDALVSKPQGIALQEVEDLVYGFDAAGWALFESTLGSSKAQNALIVLGRARRTRATGAHDRAF